MTTDFNQCLYLNGEKENAKSMLKKCNNNPTDLDWSCAGQESIDKDIFKHTMERPSGDNSQVELTHSLNTPTESIKKEDLLLVGNTETVSKEGFTNMGANYVRPGDCPDGYYWCSQSNKCKQVCMNCKFNERTYGKSKEFNEADPCFPNQGVYDGIDNDGYTQCTCGKNGQYCNEMFDAQGGMFVDDVYIMNVGDFGFLGDLAAY